MVKEGYYIQISHWFCKTIFLVTRIFFFGNWFFIFYILSHSKKDVSTPPVVAFNWFLDFSIILKDYILGYFKVNVYTDWSWRDAVSLVTFLSFPRIVSGDLAFFLKISLGLFKNISTLSEVGNFQSFLLTFLSTIFIYYREFIVRFVGSSTSFQTTRKFLQSTQKVSYIELLL